MSSRVSVLTSGFYPGRVALLARAHRRSRRPGARAHRVCLRRARWLDELRVARSFVCTSTASCQRGDELRNARNAAPRMWTWQVNAVKVWLVIAHCTPISAYPSTGSGVAGALPPAAVLVTG